jgi:hypothetical protein
MNTALHAVKNFVILVLLVFVTLICTVLFYWNAEAAEMQKHCDDTDDCVVVYDPAWSN